MNYTLMKEFDRKSNESLADVIKETGLSDEDFLELWEEMQTIEEKFMELSFTQKFLCNDSEFYNKYSKIYKIYNIDRTPRFVYIYTFIKDFNTFTLTTYQGSAISYFFDYTHFPFSKKDIDGLKRKVYLKSLIKK